ncbi:MAG TPA: hypothetical protein VMU16_03455 [Candidatus Binataceae bacterium]|nr:hypothetical protein [Candidatus Binataceae bacterium]
MTTVFIGGSRHLSQFGAPVRQRLDRIVEKRLPVLIGDANGADKAVQKYLHEKAYPNVEVFFSGGLCRNNLGNWRVRPVSPATREKSFEFYAAKDRLMAQEAAVGLMLWDGKSVGTLLNVMRLLRQHKKAVVYNAPKRRFWELKSQSDWTVFFSACDPELRSRVRQKAAGEDEERELSAAQQSLLA